MTSRAHLSPWKLPDSCFLYFFFFFFHHFFVVVKHTQHQVYRFNHLQACKSVVLSACTMLCNHSYA